MSTLISICEKCGKKIDSTSGTCIFCINQNIIGTNYSYINSGWQCPICKIVYAPFVTKCECTVKYSSKNYTAGGSY